MWYFPSACYFSNLCFIKRSQHICCVKNYSEKIFLKKRNLPVYELLEKLVYIANN